MATEILNEARQFVGRERPMLIGGDWVDSASGKTFEVFDPATGEVLANVAEGDSEDIDRAVKTARAAFETGPWSTMTPSERGRVIHRIGDLILEHGDELAALETLDNGKPMSIARAADIPLAADNFHYYSGWTTKMGGETIHPSVPYMPGAEWHAYTLREPVGVVGQIIPWNFPLLMAAWKLGPALACGCTIVLKPAEQTPLSALRLGELILEAGVPEGVLNIVTGYRRDRGCGAGRPRGRRQGGVHRLDRGRQADRPGSGRQPEEGDARARRQVAQRRLRRRRHGDRDSRSGQRDLLQPRPVLRGRIAAVRREGLYDEVLEGVAEHAKNDQGRLGPRSPDRDGTAGLP